MRRAATLAVAFALFAPAPFVLSCSSEAPMPAPALGTGEMAVSLLIGEDGLAVLDVAPVDDEWEPSPVPSDEGVAALRWELRDGAGAVLADGAVADARVARSEFDERGYPSPSTSSISWMFIDLTLPSSGGELTFFEGLADEGGPSSQPLATSNGGPAGNAAVPALHDAKGKVVEGSGHAIGEPVKIVDRGGCRTPFSILIVPDGYRAAEMDEFHEAAALVTKNLFESDFYDEQADAFTVWRQDIASAESGAGDPLTGRFPDTAFRSAYGDHGVRQCLFPKGHLNVRTAKTLKEATKATHASSVVILVNSTEHGGCASPMENPSLIAMAASLPESDPNYFGAKHHVLAHELGHALFKLADEYSEGSCDHGLRGPNVSHHLDDLPWRKLLTVPTSELPTDASDRPGTIGAFVGAQYCVADAWRPELTCKMRDLPSTFCKVCETHMREVMQRRLEKLRDRGKTTCSSSRPAPGDPGAVTPVPSGPAKPLCLGPAACTDCMAASCNGWTSACLGADWYTGNPGGPCGPAMQCLCSCTGDTAACATRCAPLSTEACSSCLAGTYSECIQTSCAGVCN